VADSGPGLAAEALEQMFAAFYTTKPDGLRAFDLPFD
jgi:C4-dicarboxylate-specific signal transduction histidine kinase